MKLDWKKHLTSKRAKKTFLWIAVLLILFIATNDFLLPWYVNRGGILTVPAVVGMQFEQAKQMLDSLGLEGRKGDVRMDRDHPEGVVIMQNPVSGSEVKSGRRVYLTVSGGEIMMTVPNLRGKTLRNATFALEREGLKLGAIEYQPSEEFPANTVIDQRVPVGAKVKRDVYVGVVVSQGLVAQSVTVPDVTGKTLAEATTVLTSSGLKPGNITYVPSADLLPNTVVDQYPRVGEMVESGRAIDLILVQGDTKK